MIAASRGISSNSESGSPFSTSANVRTSGSAGSAGRGATMVESAGVVPCLMMVPPQFSAFADYYPLSPFLHVMVVSAPLHGVPTRVALDPRIRFCKTVSSAGEEMA